MIMKKASINTSAIIGIALMFIMSFSSCNKTLSGAEKSLDAGTTWEIGESATLTGLTIAEGAVIKAPEGYCVTMTVDGIETGIKPGVYEGKVVLTVTKGIPAEYKGTSYSLRTAIAVENGKYIEDKSVPTAVAAGEVTGEYAKDIKITSVGENFNGIIVGGDSNSSYSIVNPVINFTGNGGNDLVGYGAAIMSDGMADVTVENASIITNGVVRSAVFVGGDSVMHINNSNIEVSDGASSSESGMMGVPWMLGISGYCRATNMVDNGTAYYNNTNIKAQAWGALSIDNSKTTRLYVTDSTIEVVESGYGAYSIGDCIDSFSNCKLDVPDMGLIMANENASGVFTDGTVVNSGRFGIMVHSGNYGTLTIDKGSVFNTNEAVIQVKSSYPTIIVDNAKLESKSGVILQAILNDDPNGGGGGAPAGGMSGEALGEMPGGDGGEPGGMPGGSGGGPGGMPEGSGGVPAGGMPGGSGGGPGGMPGGANANADLKATFKNVNLSGDIINAMTTLGDVIVTFENSTITGAITTATSKAQADIDGVKLSKENYYYIGDVKNTYCATDDKYGLKVTLEKSTWIVDKTSYLTGLTIAKGAALKAPNGYSVALTVDGIDRDIEPGVYEGKIVLNVYYN